MSGCIWSLYINIKWILAEIENELWWNKYMEILLTFFCILLLWIHSSLILSISEPRDTQSQASPASQAGRISTWAVSSEENCRKATSSWLSNLKTTYNCSFQQHWRSACFLCYERERTESEAEDGWERGRRSCWLLGGTLLKVLMLRVGRLIWGTRWRCPGLRSYDQAFLTSHSCLCKMQSDWLSRTDGSGALSMNALPCPVCWSDWLTEPVLATYWRPVNQRPETRI